MSQTKAQLIDPVDGTIVNADINASAAIAGTKIDPNFGSQNINTSGSAAVGNITISNVNPKIFLTDTNNNDDFAIKNNNGVYTITDQTDSVDRFTIDSVGRAFVFENGTGNGMGGFVAATAVGTAGGNAGFGFMTGGTQRFNITTIGSSGSESLRIYDNNNSAERMRINSVGNVGIGTSSPTQLMGDGGRLLHLAGSNNPEIVLERTTSGTEVKASLRITDTQTLEFALKDGTANTVRALSIHSDDGDIGLGTISPSARLHVVRTNDSATACIIANNGTTAADGLKITSGGTGAGTDILSVFRNNQSSEQEVFRVDAAGDKFMDNVFDKDANNQRKSYFTISGQLIMGRNAHESYLVFQDVSNNQIGILFVVLVQVWHITQLLIID